MKAIRYIDTNPCKESLENMFPIEGGMFCKVCQTKIYDLTNKSLDDIEINFMGKDLCVIMDETQIYSLKYIHPVKRFAVAAFFIFGTSLFTVSYSQVIENSEVVEQIDSCIVTGKMILGKLKPPIDKGIVKIETNNNIYYGVTDSKGRFSVSILKGEIIISANGAVKDIDTLDKDLVRLGRVKQKKRRPMGRIGKVKF